MTIMTPAPFALADAAVLYGALMEAAAAAGDPDVAARARARNHAPRARAVRV